MLSPELLAARAEKVAAVRAHDELAAAHTRHPFPWRASKARNLVDRAGVVVLRPGLPKRQVSAMAREANAQAAAALAESIERLNRAIKAELDATPPRPGRVGVVTVDGHDYSVEVPDVLRVSVADIAAGLRAAGLPCEVVTAKSGAPTIALPVSRDVPVVSASQINVASYHSLKRAGWDFTFVRLLNPTGLGTVGQGLPRGDE